TLPPGPRCLRWPWRTLGAGSRCGPGWLAGCLPRPAGGARPAEGAAQRGAALALGRPERGAPRVYAGRIEDRAFAGGVRSGHVDAVFFHTRRELCELRL